MSVEPARRNFTSPSQTATSEGFDKRLLAYAAVAGAGLLAAPSAEAGVIYNPTTFTNNYPGAGDINIDLNDDTLCDVMFRTSNWASWTYYRKFYAFGSYNAQLLGRVGAGDAQFIGGSNFIGPQSEGWVGSGRLAAASGSWNSTWYGSGVFGEFANTGEGYLGVRIPTVQQDSHNYGWVRLDVTASDQSPTLPIVVTVRAWAYETTPDTAIHPGDEGGVPEPGSLGLLAGGILGFPILVSSCLNDSPRRFC